MNNVFCCVLAIFTWSTLIAPVNANQQPIRISMASSLSLIFQPSTTQSSLQKMNFDVSFAASGNIVQFIKRQAPVDVAIIAGDRFKQHLLSQGHEWFDRDHKLSNPIWLITHLKTTSEQPNPPSSALEYITRMAIPNPAIAPVGARAMAAFAKHVTLCPHKLYKHQSHICQASSPEALQGKKVIETRNAQAAMQYFLTGQVDAAIVTGLQVMAAVDAKILKTHEFSVYMLCNTSLPYYVVAPNYSPLTERQRRLVKEQVTIPLLSKLAAQAVDCPTNEVNVER